MLLLDLLLRGEAPRIGQVRRIVHLADPLDLVGGKLQELQREDPSDAPAVESQNALRALGGVETVLFRQTHAHPQADMWSSGFSDHLPGAALPCRLAAPSGHVATACSVA